jgi:hypothetical protein
MAEDRSPGMVKLVYFLHRHASSGHSERYQPPIEFGGLNLREVYAQFFPRLGEGRTFDTFRGSAEGLRKGNIRDRIEDGARYLPKYESILGSWELLPRERQWADIQQYRTVIDSGRTPVVNTVASPPTPAPAPPKPVQPPPTDNDSCAAVGDQAAQTGAGFGDPVENKLVETAAVEAVAREYQWGGWSVRSVERDNCGFDLECTKGVTVEQVEVKGVRGTGLCFVITAGEVRQARENPKFVLVVVTSALSPSPTLTKFSGVEFGQQFDLAAIQYRASLKR